MLASLALLAALLAPPNPVTNGSFETLAADGMAVDWSHVGVTVGYAGEGRTGDRSIRLWREAGQEGEVGFNRGWRADSGQQGAMLTELKGALVYWYKAIRLDGAVMQFQAIPMDATAWEKTDSPRRIVTVPASHAGDGQWHRAALAYDFAGDPKAKWVHVSARLQGPGAGEVLVDDVSYLERIGPQPQVTALRIVAARPDWFDGGTLTGIVTNNGDAPCGAVELSVQCPPGLTAGQADTAIAGLGPDQFRRVSWPLHGRRSGGRIAVSARSGENDSIEALDLAPAPRLTAVLVDPSRAVAGRPVMVTVTVDNRGNAAGELRVIGEPTHFEPAGPTVLSGRQSAEDPWRTIYTWPLTARASTEGRLRIRLLDGEREVARQDVAVAFHSGDPLRWQALAPGLDVAEEAGAGDRPAVGRVSAAGQTLAELPHLGRVVYRRGNGSATVSPVAVAVAGGVLTATRADPDGGIWTFKLFARPGAAPGTITVASIIRCNQARDVLAVHGLDILVPGRRGEAMMPGLEWLAPHEYSGSDYDIDQDHPERRRLTPHPNRVTIPYLSVATEDGVVALLWDAHDRWLRGFDCPQPVFDSPNRADHRAETRLGLMAPNVPHGLSENELRAARPLRLAAGEAVTLRGTIYADAAARSPLAGQEAWLRTYRPEPILPYPRGSARAELELCARGYIETLWRPAEQDWLPFLLGPSVMRTPGRPLDFYWDLTAFAALEPASPLAQPARDRAALAERLAGRPPSHGEEWGYLFGDPLASIEGGIAVGGGSLAELEPDGTLGYQPPLQNAGVFKGYDYHDLGEPGEKADGLFARRVARAFRAARLVGAGELMDDAEAALAALERFTIPRAAQVWEVPVHTPDILAAAESCEALCEAYLLTGERRWLDAARYRAYGGLSFIYLWNEPGKPWMRYGSIPVLGASLRHHSWFGNIVQWNGIAFADALLLLDRIDDAPPPLGGLRWRDVARGIMVSAMYQQRTDAPYVACWPDSMHTVTQVRAQWEFAPRRVLELHHELLGRFERPRTWLVEQGASSARLLARDAVGGPSATVSAGADLAAASWRGETLRLTFRQPAAPMPIRVSVAGIARPAQVAIDGAAGVERPTLQGATEPCYRYHTAGCAVAVVLPAAEACTLELRGATPRRGTWRAPLADRLEFGFDDGAEGWRPHNDLTEPAFADGLASMTTTGGDPYFVRDGCRIAGDSVRRVRIRMSVAGTGDAQFYWTTSASPVYDETKVLRFVVPPGGEMREYVLEVGDLQEWRGHLITGLRLDPINGGTGLALRVDSVRGER